MCTIECVRTSEIIFNAFAYVHTFYFIFVLLYIVSSMPQNSKFNANLSTALFIRSILQQLLVFREDTICLLQTQY